MLRFRTTKKSNCNKLAIIGNGFDLAHNYETLYCSFVNNTSSSALEKFKSYCVDEPAIVTWYDLENNICILTEKLFLQSYDETCDYEENRIKVKELRVLFSEISYLLIEYLKKEVSSKPFKPIESIKRTLDFKTVAINFNYTDTAHKYIKNVINIHGSLIENDIILGYDYRDEPCLAQYEDICWSKSFCRESLELRRFLRKTKKIISSKKQKALMSALESYHHWENSGRGMSDEVQKFIPSYYFINWFISKQRRRSKIDKIKYSSIDTIIILGHGINADRKLIENIVLRCNALNEVVIYRYKGESDYEFERKKISLNLIVKK